MGEKSGGGLKVKFMRVTYIGHSGFLVETDACYYLFDYYKGNLPELASDKPIFVFASHGHGDHYNPEIFEILQNLGMQQITAVLSKDISARKYPEGIPVVKVTFHQTYELPCRTTVRTLHSTDLGVAFLVSCPQGILYHGGDLHDWVWEGEAEQDNRQMTGNYRREIDLLAGTLEGQTLDIAFLPLDPRQEKEYAHGILYFLKKIKVRTVYPMHYWDQPEIIGKFLGEYPEYEQIVRNTERSTQK